MNHSNNHKKVQKLTLLGLLAAISIVLVGLIHFPLMPAAPFLEYDPADIPIFIGTFLLGPVGGFLLTVVASTIQGLTVSAAAGPIGIIMHILATGIFTVVAGNIYRRKKSKKSALLALLAGVIAQTGMMVLCNMIFTPIFMGAPLEDVIGMLVPIIIPFNLIKGGINAVVTYVVYKPVSNFAHKLLGEKTEDMHAA